MLVPAEAIAMPVTRTIAMLAKGMGRPSLIDQRL
jgi:hypothetical protein